MRFLVDECTGPSVARWLRDQGHDVFSVYEEARGTDDDSVIQRAATENRILVTNDKDFGEKVFRDRAVHAGVVLLRLQDESADGRVTAIRRLLEFHSERIVGAFVVVTDKQVRFAKL